MTCQWQTWLKSGTTPPDTQPSHKLSFVTTSEGVMEHIETEEEAALALERDRLALEILGLLPMEESLSGTDAAGTAGPADAEPASSKKPAHPAVSTDALQAIFSDKASHELSQAPYTTAFQTVLEVVEQTPDFAILEELSKICRFYLSPGKPHLHISKEGISQLTGVPAKNVEPLLNSFAPTFWQAERAEQALLEKAVVESGATLVAYLEFVRFDETPMKVGHKQVSSVSTPMAAQRARTQGAQSSQKPSVARPEATELQLPRLATTSKMLAVENRFLMLLKVDVAVDTEQPAEFIALCGTSLTPLRLVDRATGSSLRRCVGDASPASTWAESFPVKMRVTTTDQAQANMAAEKGVLHDRGHSWGSLHLPCNMHMVAMAFSKTFSLCEEQISGMVNLALCLSVGGNMVKFREALAEVVGARLVVLKGVPPPEVETHRRCILELFGQTGRNIAVRNYLLRTLPNGDWRKQDVVEVYVPATMDYDFDQLKHKVTQSLILGLTGTLFRLYPRHRWVGADATTDQVGMLQAVHGLGTAAFQVFLGKVTSVPADQPQQGDRTGSEEAAQEQFGVPGFTSFEGYHFSEAASGSAGMDLVLEQRPGLTSSSADMAAAEVDWSDLSQLNSRQRKKAAAWLESCPLPHLMGMRLCMQPLSHLLFQYLQRAGQTWELEQRAKEAESLQLNQGPARTTSLLEYLSLTSENKFFQNLQDLLDSKSWSSVDSAAWTLEFQTLFFRMTSRMGALVQQVLVAPTSQFPLRFLDLFWDGRAGKDELLSAPPCCLDSFSKYFLEVFPGDKLHSQEAEATFSAIVQCAQTETVGLEWGHGRVSRLLRASSTQTHTPSMSFLNGQFLCTKHQHRSASTSTSTSQTTEVQPSEGRGSRKRPAVQAKAKALRGGGGAWRAFVSKRTKFQEGRVNTKELAADYQEAKRWDTQEFQQSRTVGQAATLKHRLSGGPSFGEEHRAIRRRRITLNPTFHRGGAAGSSTASGGQSASASEAWTSAATQSLKGQLREVRREASSAARAKKQVLAGFKQEVSKFLEEHGQAVVERVLAVIPEALKLAPCMHVIPKAGMSQVEVAYDSVDVSTTITSWTLANSKTSNLKATLEKHWRSVNEMLQDSKQSPLPAVTERRGRCVTYGHCFCGARGKEVWRLRNQFLKSLKASFQRGMEERKGWLVNGFVVVCLTSLLEEGESANSAFAELASDYLEEETALDPMLSSKVIWLHIALMYLKPYRPTFQLLFEEASLEQDRKVLRQSGKFFTEFDFWFNISLEQSWNMQYFRVLSTKAPQPELKPAMCVVKPHTLTPEVLWPLPKKTRTRRAVPTDVQAAWPLPALPSSLEEPGHSADVSREDADSAKSEEAEEEGSSDEGLDLGEDAQAQDSDPELQLDHLLEEAFLEKEEDLGARADRQRDEAQEQEALHAVLELEAAEREEVLLQPQDEGEAGAEVLEAPALQEVMPVVEEQPQGAARPAAVAQALGQAAARGALARNKALLTTTVEGGTISYYAQGFFTATCRQPGHGKCVLSRTSVGGSRAQQGRPLGLMVAWLGAAHRHATKAEHWDRRRWPDHATRLHHRGLLRQLPGGPSLLEQERTLEAGEPEEPLECP